MNYEVISEEGMKILAEEFDLQIRQEYEERYLDFLKEKKEKEKENVNLQ